MSTFTPIGQDEPSKTCTACHKYLTAGKFRMKKITKDDIKGIQRNGKCRICEDGKAIIRNRNVTKQNSDDIVSVMAKIIELQNRVSSLEATRSERGSVQSPEEE